MPNKLFDPRGHTRTDRGQNWSEKTRLGLGFGAVAASRALSIADKGNIDGEALADRLLKADSEDLKVEAAAERYLLQVRYRPFTDECRRQDGAFVTTKAEAYHESKRYLYKMERILRRL